MARKAGRFEPSAERGTIPVVANNPTRKNRHSFNECLSPAQSHRTRALPFEGLETHRNPFRQTPTYFAATALAAAMLWWT
jgi:hypothetical protein